VQAIESTHQDEKRSVAISALIMAGGTMISRILGFVREMIMYAYFDRTVTDAYLAAFRIPNTFRRLLGEGSLSISFIPVFIDLLRKGHTQNSELSTEAQKLVNGVFTILVTFLTILTACGIIFSEQIAYLLVSGKGFMEIPGKFELTVKMTRIMFAFIFFISLYAYFMAILNSLKRFAVAAFAPTMFNIVMVISALLPEPVGTFDGFFLAVGVIVGGFLEMTILIPSLIKEGYFPKFTRQVRSPHIKRIFKTMGPSLFGVAILQLTQLVNLRFASELAEGTVSWIYLADRVLELPLALFSVSLGSALLPTLSRLWSGGHKDQMIDTSAFYLRMVYFLAIPATVGIAALAQPIVQVLFERGQFDPAETAMTAKILQVYSMVILTYGGLRVVVVPFYAIKNTWVPAASAGFALLVHVFLAARLIGPLGVVGLNLSIVCSSALNLTLLIVFHHFLIGPIPYGKFLAGIFKFAAAAFGMWGVLIFHQDLAASIPLPAQFAKIIALATAVIAGGAVYFGLAHVLRAEEARATWSAVVRRIRRRPAVSKSK
jgi:putative peptidoglycan lipid II flippase